jgi:hypothetical protein
VGADEPQIALPAWYRSESGLMLPSSVQDLAPAPVPATPRDLRSAPQPVAVAEGGPPSGLDQVAVFFAESEAGLEQSRLRDLRRWVSGVPFESAMLSLARIAAKTFAIRGDETLQLRLAEDLFADAPIVERMRTFMAEKEGRGVLFAEQHIFILLRLTIERAREAPLDEALDEDTIKLLRAALIGVTSATEWIAAETGKQALAGTLDEAVAFFVQNGIYNRKPQPMGELTRAQELYERIARAKTPETSPNYCPLDAWMTDDYKFDNAEQMSFGFALAAMTTTWTQDWEAGSKSYVVAEHLQDLFIKLGWQGREAEACELLSADRRWYQEAFAAGGDGPESVAWEIRPFMQRPFLRLENGGLVLLSPRALTSWLSEGFHFRLLDAAQRRNTTKKRKASRRYTAFAGELFETYCLELGHGAYPGERPIGGGRVYGEQRYGKKGEAKTSDVAIHLGTDLVLMEMSVSRPRADTLIFQDPKAVGEDLRRMIIAKISQLDGCIRSLLNGTATIPAEKPEVDVKQIERIWPVIVTAGEVVQNELIWAWIRRESTGLLNAAKVQPLTLLDIEDYEALMGLVEDGRSLIEILEGKAARPYRDLELAMWLRDDPKRPKDRAARPSMIEQAFAQATDRAREYIDLSKGLPPRDAAT